MMMMIYLLIPDDLHPSHWKQVKWSNPPPKQSGLTYLTYRELAAEAETASSHPQIPLFLHKTQRGE